MLSYVGVKDNETNHGLEIITNTSREFEVIPNPSPTIAITLFRSVGVLGKEELVRRPGRPSDIKLPTPDSQMIGKCAYELGFTMLTLDDELCSIGKRYLTPFVTYNKILYNAMRSNPAELRLKAASNLLSLTGNGLLMSALKKAE